MGGGFLTFENHNQLVSPKPDHLRGSKPFPQAASSARTIRGYPFRCKLRGRRLLKQRTPRCFRETGGKSSTTPTSTRSKPARSRQTRTSSGLSLGSALSDHSTLTSQKEAVDRALLAARDTTNLATERYQKGLSSYLDVVDAQREALQAERQEAQLRGQLAITTILLAKALGGGWNTSESAE
jgi:hypothetical protein